MTELERIEAELLDPRTGELVPAVPDALANWIASTMDYIRAAYRAMDEGKRLLAEEAQRRGTGTLNLDGVTVTVTPPAYVWDVEALDWGLRNAGCPEETINEVIRQTVSWTVDARRADRLARANEAYAEVVERCRHRKDEAPKVSVKR